MLAVFFLMLLLWTTKPVHGIPTGVVALLGVCLLLLTGVETWKDSTSNVGAWDALVWLGGLISMANAVKDKGVVAWFAKTVQEYVNGLEGLAVVLVLALIYFYSMYGFSMLTGHITAMVGAFFAVALASEAPALLTVAILAYFSNLCGCLTNYSSGPVVIYFGLGYVPASTWFRGGFIVSLFHLSIWLSAGLFWWKVLGWW